jgi:hypothetical protein
MDAVTTPQSAETPVLEQRMSDAFKAGRASAAAGEPRTNPWRGDSDNAEDRVLCTMWGRGYSAGNPVNLDQADDSEDAEPVG